MFFAIERLTSLVDKKSIISLKGREIVDIYVFPPMNVQISYDHIPCDSLRR